MAEQSENVTVNDLIEQINNFETTIKNLSAHVATLKQKLSEKQQQYGDDLRQWPGK